MEKAVLVLTVTNSKPEAALLKPVFYDLADSDRWYFVVLDFSFFGTQIWKVNHRLNR